MINIQEALKRFDEAMANSRAPKTARSYHYSLRRFVEFLRSRGISERDIIERIETEHFIAYPSWLAGKVSRKGSRDVYLSAAKAFFDWMVIEGYLKPNYVETARYSRAVRELSRKRESRLPKTPPAGAVERVLAAARSMKKQTPILERDIALLEFLASTGCRIDEARQLRVKNVDLSERSAVVVGKGSKERVVYFSTSAASALTAYWKARGFSAPNHPAFCRHDHGYGKKRPAPVTTKTIWLAVKGAVSASGIEFDFTPHSFRHAFATKMLEVTDNLAIVQDMLGHSSPVTTRVYAKAGKEKARSAHQAAYK